MLQLIACTSIFLLPSKIDVDWDIPGRYKKSTVLNRASQFAEKEIALTFDDGPDPKVTPVVLDILKKYKVKATFFVLGKAAKKHPMLLRRIALEGHAIGNHSWSHGKEKTKDQAISELIRTNNAIIFATGNCPKIFRAPYGIRDGEYAAQSKAMGMTNILWTSIDGDTKTKSPAEMIAYVGTPKNGEIILCHDGPGKSNTVKMLPTLLAKLNKKGYKFQTVPELLRKYDSHLVQLSKTDGLAIKEPKKLVALRKPAPVSR